MPRTGALPTALLVATCAATFLGTAGLVVTGTSTGFDAAVMDAVRSPDLRDPLGHLRTITEAGSTWAVMILAGVALGVGVAIGPWLHGVIAAAVIGIASVGNTLLKTLVARGRPDIIDAIVAEPGYSFPSGHAALGMAGWGILAVLVWRTRLPPGLRAGLVVTMGVVIALIGLSRVYLGVHFPTDVLAGWSLGAVIVLLYERFTRTVSREPAAAAVDADPAARRSDPPAAG